MLNLQDPIVNDILLNTQVCQLISTCTLKPRQLGVYHTNIDSSYTLSEQLERLIKTTSTKDAFFDALKQQLMDIVRNEKDILDFNRLNVDNELCSTMKRHIKGLMILKKSNVVQEIDSVSTINFAINKQIHMTKLIKRYRNHKFCQMSRTILRIFSNLW